MAVDEAKLNEFLGKAVGDLGAAISATRFSSAIDSGLPDWRRAADLADPWRSAPEPTSATFANGSGIRAPADTCSSTHASDEWSLSPEQALCLTDPNGPVDMPGAYNIVEATFHALGRTLENFRSGAGMEWGEHHPCLFDGTERFFRAGYNSSLIGSWLPALDGVVDKLESGREGGRRRLRTRRQHHPDGEVLSATRSSSATTITPNRSDGCARRPRPPARPTRGSRSSDAVGYPDTGFDLIAFFDCLHDMGDPVGVVAHARQAINDDGTAMIVEPFANDRVHDNLNPWAA